MSIPLIGLIVPLLALPAVTQRFGAEAWAALAVGQAAGAIAAAAVELGWGWNGPLRVARAKTDAARRGHLAVATYARLLAAAFAVPAAAAIAAVSVSHYRGEAAVAAVAAALLGLSSSWYFIGLGRPWLLLVVDGVPRLIGVALSIALVSAGADFMTYPVVGLLLPSVVAAASGAVVGGLRWNDLVRLGVRRAARAGWSQSSVVTSRLLSSLYMSAPALLLSTVAPVGEVARFAAGDRLTRMGLTALSPLPSALQNWVGREPRILARHRRAWLAVLMNSAVGLVAGVATFALLPWLSHVVLSGTSTVSSLQAAALGVLVLVVCTSRAVGGIVLVVLSGTRAYLASTLAGAATGVIGVLVLGRVFGATGAICAVTLAELVVLTTQLVAASLASRRARARREE